MNIFRLVLIFYFSSCIHPKDEVDPCSLKTIIELYTSNLKTNYYLYLMEYKEWGLDNSSLISIMASTKELDVYEKGAFVSTFNNFEIHYVILQESDSIFIEDSTQLNSSFSNELKWYYRKRKGKKISSENLPFVPPTESFGQIQILYNKKNKCFKFLEQPSNKEFEDALKSKCSICTN